MKIEKIMAASRLDSPVKLTTAYALFGSLWILGSDLAAALWAEKDWEIHLLDSAKGLFFIAVTSVLLYALTRRLVRRQEKAAAARRETELRWQFALRGVGDGLWDWDVATDRVFYSNRWKEMLGHTEDEIGDSPREWEDRVHPDDRPAVQKLIDEHLAGRTPMYVSEHRLRRKDGSWLWVLDRGQLVSRHADGRPLRVVGTHHDITAAKRAEKELADTLAFLEALIHRSPIGIIAYGSSGAAVLANEAAARIVGADVPGLLRQNFREIRSWRDSGLLAAAEKALAAGQTVAHEGAMVTTFGRAIRFAAQLVPFEHDGGRQLLLLFTDVTQRVESEEMLQTLRSALEATPSGIVLTDPRGVIEWVNPAFTKLTGYSREEAVGRNPRILKSNRHAPDFYAHFWGTISRGEIWQGEITNSRKDGSLYREHMTVAPIRNGDGRIAHFVAIKNDISAMKTLEQQLARTQRLDSIGLLASGIAHDLNNIFAPILLSLELLKVKYPTADARKTLELIESAGQRGAGIVKQILTFARGAEGERVELQPKYLLKELAQMLRETLSRHIEVRLEQAAGGLVTGNATQLHQVLLNLAINARDAMPDGGRLTLGLGRVEADDAWRQRHPSLRPGPHVALSVADTGPGIAPAVLERIFEPFFTTKPLGQGTGLGLSTAYGIVRSHGGVIDVSTELGRGSRFTVLLPMRPEAAERAGSNAPMDKPAFHGRGRRLLLADDEEAIRLVTMHSLQRHGFVVEVAVDGAEALEFFRAAPHGPFAAVITDMMMPRMGGIALVEGIRQLDQLVPVITSSGLSSGTPTGASRARLLELGVRTMLRKPYTEAELLGALRAELEPESEPETALP